MASPRPGFVNLEPSSQVDSSAEGSPPVMADVARLAGVSLMTVSRVLSGNAKVAPPTRSRVEAAIEELGYRANVAARTLAGGRSHALGALALKHDHYGPASALFGIEVSARRFGSLVNFVSLSNPDVEEIRTRIDHLQAAHVEGLIVIAPLKAAVRALQEINPGIPMVVTTDAKSLGSTVSIDQRHGARIATRHLLELGHRTVHHVRGARGWIDADMRVAGWKAELKAKGCTIPDVVDGDWTPESGYEAGKSLAKQRGVSAVFVANDQMALGLLLAFHEAGRKVPDEISVVGFDDLPEAGYFTPPLTTVKQDFEQLGQRSVEQLLAMIEGRPSGQIVLQPTLQIRASTARA